MGCSSSAQAIPVVPPGAPPAARKAIGQNPNPSATKTQEETIDELSENGGFRRVLRPNARSRDSVFESGSSRIPSARQERKFTLMVIGTANLPTHDKPGGPPAGGNDGAHAEQHHHHHHKEGEQQQSPTTDSQSKEASKEAGSEAASTAKAADPFVFQVCESDSSGSIGEDNGESEEEEEEERPRTFIQPRPSQDFMQRYRNIKFKLPATEEVDEPVHQNEEEVQHWRAMKRLELEGTVLPAITYEPPSPNPTPTASAAVTPFPSTAASRASTAQHAAAGSVMQGRPLSAGRQRSQHSLPSSTQSAPTLLNGDDASVLAGSECPSSSESASPAARRKAEARERQRETVSASTSMSSLERHGSSLVKAAEDQERARAQESVNAQKQLREEQDKLLQSLAH